MKLRFGIIIFIIVLLQSEAKLSPEFSIFSLNNLKNFVANLININQKFPDSNATVEIMHEISIEIQNILRDAAENGINICDTNINYKWDYSSQSVEVDQTLSHIMNRIISINMIFNEKFLTSLDHSIFDSKKHQSYNISEDPDINNYVINAAESLSKIRWNLFYQIYPDNSTFLQKLVNELNIAHAKCESKINYQSLLSEFFTYVMKAELQVLTMTVSVNELMRVGTGTNFLRSWYPIINSFQQEWKSHLKTMKENLKNLSTKFYNCFQITSEAFLSEVHIIDLLPIHVNYSSNKVAIKIGLTVRNTILTLHMLESPILPYGEILEDTSQERIIFSNNLNYWNPYEENFDSEYSEEESCPIVEDVTKDFWKNVQFLPTSVPKDCVVVGAKIEILHLHSKRKKLIYLRLQYAKFNKTFGTIDPASVEYTKLWTQDDPELKRISITEATDGSFEKNIEIPDTDARGYEKIGRLPNDFRVRMRQEQYINYRVDCDPLSPRPLRPLTALSFWKSNHQNKKIYYLSLQASLYDLSENIDTL